MGVKRMRMIDHMTENQVIASPNKRVCKCGCGTEFVPYNSNNIYYKDHRHTVYKVRSHMCPLCGGIHRIKKKEKEE
jgi:acetone carboxylase gamma subunit